MTGLDPHETPLLTKTVVDSKGSVLALIFRASEDARGVHFVTPHDYQQQVAFMNRPSGERIPAHTHLPVPRSVKGTQEVLVVRSGQLQVDLYDSDHNHVATEVAGSGEVIILVDGGHGFTVLEDCEFIEVKQGPYVPGNDKEVFEKVTTRRTLR